MRGLVCSERWRVKREGGMGRGRLLREDKRGCIERGKKGRERGRGGIEADEGEKVTLRTNYNERERDRYI